ncbi:hypothetical protein MLD38_012955 [Melastoma candidum]|uniref:Uncharacterized protein n=1 Tax=Melastoma candidum TaxID=119954 RepID=A0ACB9RGG8_9MYRT|nr:hypothetical protein MLD38_012955 [Melastoma candidum]
MDDEIEEGMVVEDEDHHHQQAHSSSDAPRAYEMLKDARVSAEEIVSRILAVKKEGLPKSQLRELVTQMFLNFVVLRQANRSILLEEDRVKAETERAKAPVDFTTLQLHNFMYEKNHYVKAIKACRDFKSKYPDIELVPEEEFLHDAPQEIKGSTASDDAHKLMIKRLNFELYQRKELCKLHEELEQRKKSLVETIANRKKFLSSLPSHLKSLKKASLPIQNQLGLLHTKKLKQHHLAELLPPPLYVIYSQLVAQKEAFDDNIDLEIGGSGKDAQTFVRQLAMKDSGISSNSESSRLEDDAPDEDDDGQRRRKRPKKVLGRENLEGAGFLQVHPLRVILNIYDDEALDKKSDKLVTLKFEYVLKLNVVCVGIEGSNERLGNILCNLFPNDDGLNLPHQSAKLVVGDSPIFDERKSFHPYKWAQHLAGIDFLPEMSPYLVSNENPSSEMTQSETATNGISMYRQQNRVPTILQRIRSRVKAQLALAEQLETLDKLKWPAVDYKCVPWGSRSPLCKLHSWSSMGSISRQVSPRPVMDVEKVPEPVEGGGPYGSKISKDDVVTLREDGELPSLVAVAVVADDYVVTPSKVSSFELSRQVPSTPKSISPLQKVKSLSFKRVETELDILLDSDSDGDEGRAAHEVEDIDKGYHLEDKSWVKSGVREFCLVFSRDDGGYEHSKLEAKIEISMEYPLRPPLFSLSLRTASSDGIGKDKFEWYNGLRNMEAEVNHHMLKSLPLDQENYILAHQVHFLAMLFDSYLDEVFRSSKKRESTSIIDVGSCVPAAGEILSRPFRGRDRRKIISWSHPQ